MIINFRFAVKNPPFLNGDANLPFFYNQRTAKKNNWDYATCVTNLRNKYILETFGTQAPLSGGLYKVIDFYTYQIVIPVEMGDVYEVFKRKYMELKLPHEEFTRYGWITDISYSTENSMLMTFATDEWTTFFEKLEFDPETSLEIKRRMPNRYVKNGENLIIDFYGLLPIQDGGVNQYISDNLFYDDVKCEKYLVDIDPVLNKSDTDISNKNLNGFFMGDDTTTTTTPTYYVYALILPNSNYTVENHKFSLYASNPKTRKLPTGAFIAPCGNINAFNSSGDISGSYSQIAEVPNANIIGIFVLPIPPKQTTATIEAGTSQKDIGVYADEIAIGGTTVVMPTYPDNWNQIFTMQTISTPILNSGFNFNTLHLNDPYIPQYSPVEYIPPVVEWKFTGITGESAAYSAPLLNSGSVSGQKTDFSFQFDISLTAGLAAWTWTPQAPIVNRIKAFSYSTYFDSHIPNGASAWTNYMQNNKSQFNTSLLQNSMGVGAAGLGAGGYSIAAGYRGANAISDAEAGTSALAKRVGVGAASEMAELGALGGVVGAGFIGLTAIMGAAFRVANQMAQKHDLMRQAAQVVGQTSQTALTNFQWLMSNVSGEGARETDYYVGVFSEWRIPTNVLRQLHINAYLYGNPIIELISKQFIQLQTREMWDVWFIDNAETAFLRGNVAESVLDRISAKFALGIRIWHYQEKDGFDSVYNYNRMNWETSLEVQE